MTPEEAFHKVILDQGGRFDISQLPPCDAYALFVDHAFRIRGYLDQLQTVSQKYPPMHFDWIANDQVNAVAFNGKEVNNPHYFIGIYMGALLFLHLVFENMVASKQFFPRIGDYAGENDFQAITDFIPHMAHFRVSKVNWFTPKDPIRRDFAILLIRMVIDFLFNHELTHILDGHVGYVNSVGVSAMLEIPGANSPGSESYRLSRHMMELCADSYAMTAGLREIMSACEHPEIARPLGRFYCNRFDVLAYWAFALSFFFRIFSGFDDAYHPPTTMRQAKMCIHAEAAIKTYWPTMDIDMANKSLAEGCVGADKAFAHITGKGEATFDALNQAFFDLPQYEKTLATYWENTLKPKIEAGRYAFRKLPGTMTA